MIGFLGNLNTPVADNILFGKDALSNNVGGTGTINKLSISNCNARYLFVSSDVSEDPASDLPDADVWHNDYIMKDNLAQNASAGNFAAVLDSLTSFLIKRRRMSDPKKEWIIIAEIPVEATTIQTDGIELSVSDYTAVNNEEYAYAIVPYFIEGDIVREGAIDENAESLATVISDFDGIYICSPTQSYKLYSNISYDTLTQVNPVGVHETLGNRFPITVSNSSINYKTGGVSGMILNKEYINGIDVKLDREKLTFAREEFEDFISEKEPKIIKDWNKNIWLAYPSDNPEYTFNSEWGLGLCDLHFTWVEIGKADNSKDLQLAKFITRIKEKTEV